MPVNAPAGQTFEGVAGRNLANPIPATAVGQSAPPPGVTSIPVSPVPAPANYHQPFPDPGEEYGHQHPHDHTSFLKTMFEKRCRARLPRGVHRTGPARGVGLARYPETADPPGLWDVDFSTAPLNDLQRSMVGSAAVLAGVSQPQLRTHGEAMAFLRRLAGLPGQNPRPGSNACS